VVILAFDSCFGGCSVAVMGDGVCLAEAAVPPAPGQADLLVQLVAEALARAGLTVRDMDRIAVTLGPGGFTGVRVGVAAARALVLATGIPVVAATSLHVMAVEAVERCAASLKGRELITAVDAHRGELYVQSFDASGAPVTEPQAVAIDDAAWLAPGTPLLAVGTGAVLLAESARKRGLDVEVGLPTLLPSAQYLGVLARRLAPLPAAVQPLYLRPPDAKPSSMLLPSRAP
jgi:tRNA threonylcarbamoyladenosine biosynthesis protein TsaB